MYELLKPAIAGPGGALLAGETRGQRLPINPFSRRGRWTTGERCRQPIETTGGVLAAGRCGPGPHAGDPGLVAAS